MMIAPASYSPPRPLYYPPYCLEHPEFPRITNTGSLVSKKISSRQIHHIINIPEHKNNYATWPLDAATNSSGNVYVSSPAAYTKTRAHMGQPSAKRTNKTRGHRPRPPPRQLQRRVEGSPRPGPATFLRSNETRLIWVTPPRHPRSPRRGASGS